jgi:cyclopropane-fatty-acyl-phospholipid synthase
MGRHFFTGGQMPSADALLWFPRDLGVEERWLLDGTHYERTANHWLANQDKNRAALLKVLGEAYGAGSAALWLQRWRMFFMACAETFGYARGQQWLIAHLRFARTQ